MSLIIYSLSIESRLQIVLCRSGSFVRPIEETFLESVTFHLDTNVSSIFMSVCELHELGEFH